MINTTDKIKVISTKSINPDHIFDNDSVVKDKIKSIESITFGPTIDLVDTINKKPCSRESHKESDNKQIRSIMNMFNTHVQNIKNSEKRDIEPVTISDPDNTVDLNNLNDDQSNKFSDLTPLMVTQLTQLSILPIGDVSLELIIFALGEGQLNTNIADLGMPRLKKDYVTFIINSLCTDVTRYSVYALLFNNSTSVMDVIYKKNMDVPIIIYSTTDLDPTDFINNVYFYQTQRNRSLNLKSVAAQQNNPNRLIPLSIVQLPAKRPDLYFTNDILVQTADDSMIELQVIIRNHAYISETPNEDLLKMIITMISF